MTPRRRRWWWAVAAAAVVALLAGGRWAALETAERLWAATIPGGAMYLAVRALARWFDFAIIVLAVGWATSNLYVVYRAIGSVQLPRRLGDLEIVEAVPRRILLGATLVSGLVLGLLLTWGTGDWWRAAALAGAPPHFGVSDPVLHRDVGYYLATLPWAAQLQNHVLATVGSVLAVVTFLYFGIGALAWRDGRLHTSGGARRHLGFLLACLGATLAWGARLDPGELVAGLHGTADRAMLGYRLAGATAVMGLGVIVALASAAWAWTGRGAVLSVAWAAYLIVAPLLYWGVPGVARSARGGARVGAGDTVRMVERRRLADLALGAAAIEEAPPAFDSPVAATRHLPLWDRDRVAAVASPRVSLPVSEAVTPSAVAQLPDADRTWLLVPLPDDAALRKAAPAPTWSEVHRGTWSRTGPPWLAVETDTGLPLQRLAVRNPVALYGPGFNQYAVMRAVEHGPGSSGIPLRGGWRRLALAWALQSPELVRDEETSADDELLWRRDVVARLERLAPFAEFGTPRAVIADSALWWTSWGYVSSASFPLVVPVQWRERRVRYLRPAVLGATEAATGVTRLYLAPGHDALAAAWARVFAPLILPADSLPDALRARLAPPAEWFAVLAGAWLTLAGDSGWVRRPTDPYELIAPAPDALPGDAGVTWDAAAYEAGSPARSVGLLTTAVTAAGPRLYFWRPGPGPAPQALVGSQRTKPGVLRVWPVDLAPFGLQASFAQAVGSTEAPAVDRVYVSWGPRRADGATAGEALAAFLAGDGRAPAGTLQERWDRARALMARADSALQAGDLERFARLYAQLKALLAPPGRPD